MNAHNSPILCIHWQTSNPVACEKRFIEVSIFKGVYRGGAKWDCASPRHVKGVGDSELFHFLNLKVKNEEYN